MDVNGYQVKLTRTVQTHALALSLSPFLAPPYINEMLDLNFRINAIQY